MSRFVVNISWDEVPHLSDAEKQELWASIPAYQRDARARGIPLLGEGRIYPFDDERLKIDPFKLPREYPRWFGMDTDNGAGFTAIVWMALDRENQTVYIYDVYKSESRSLADHIEALRVRGRNFKKNPLWIPGVGDAKGLMVTQEDSEQLISLYQNAGANISVPDKAVEAGIQDVYDLLNQRRLRVFSHCHDWFAEFRMYHRRKQKVVKINDHLMDATRYAIRSGIAHAMVEPIPDDETPQVLVYNEGMQGTTWLGM
jgi:phage terminase large subunit